MGKSIHPPKTHVISCRVNEEELETIQELARQYGDSISNLLRYALNLSDPVPSYRKQNAPYRPDEPFNRAIREQDLSA